MQELIDREVRGESQSKQDIIQIKKTIFPDKNEKNKTRFPQDISLNKQCFIDMDGQSDTWCLGVVVHLGLSWTTVYDHGSNLRNRPGSGPGLQLGSLVSHTRHTNIIMTYCLTAFYTQLHPKTMEQITHKY